MACLGKIDLEKALIFGTFPALPNDPKRNSQPESEAGRLPDPDQDRTLEAATHDICGVLLADGTFDGDEDRLDLISGQLEIIAIAALRHGYFHENPIILRMGGVEHDIAFVGETATVLKFTKPGRAAYAVHFDLGTPTIEPALPLEYLDRLILQNEIFGDNLRFVGISGEAGSRRLVTRQDLVKGMAASWNEIISLMVDQLGFTKLRHNHGIGYEDSLAFVRDDAVVFDMRPANVFITDEGTVVPVDCIPVRLPMGKRSFFDR